MGRITVKISDALEKRIRDYLVDKYYKKGEKLHGKLQFVIEEALDEFLTKRGVK